MAPRGHVEEAHRDEHVSSPSPRRSAVGCDATPYAPIDPPKSLEVSAAKDPGDPFERDLPEAFPALDPLLDQVEKLGGGNPLGP